MINYLYFYFVLFFFTVAPNRRKTSSGWESHNCHLTLFFFFRPFLQHKSVSKWRYNFFCWWFPTCGIMRPKQHQWNLSGWDGSWRPTGQPGNSNRQQPLFSIHSLSHENLIWFPRAQSDEIIFSLSFSNIYIFYYIYVCPRALWAYNNSRRWRLLSSTAKKYNKVALAPKKLLIFFAFFPFSFQTDDGSCAVERSCLWCLFETCRLDIVYHHVYSFDIFLEWCWKPPPSCRFAKTGWWRRSAHFRFVRLSIGR